MNQKTAIGEMLGTAGEKVQYDEHVKRVLGNKDILAWLLKETVEEYSDSTIHEIIGCIEPDIQLGDVPLRPNDRDSPYETERNIPCITGDCTEDKVPGEGTVFFDIRFHAFAMEKGNRIKLLVNVEAQKEFYQSYEFVTRGIFYGARMISAQLGREFEDSHYENMKKVYSIWICMNAPKKIGNAMAIYSIEKKNIVGDIPSAEKDYDKLSVVVICLNEKAEGNQIGIHRLLSVLLSPKMKSEEKKRILSEEFHIEMEKELGKELEKMCNLSEAIEEGGIQKGIQKGMDKERITVVENLMRNLNISLDKALEAAGITKKAYEKSLKNLKMIQ